MVRAFGFRRCWIPVFAALLGLVACDTGADEPAFPPPADDYTQLGLSAAEAASLLSLEQVGDHPLFTMRHYAKYGYEEFTGDEAAEAGGVSEAPDDRAWACSLFAAFADPESRLFGRNFDWSFSPSLLLYTDPPDGYAAAALVNISYLGFAGQLPDDLTAKPIEELAGLLDAHHIPFDGMNEAGLAIGMAAVTPGEVPTDPDKDTIGSLGIIRVVLDQAATVDEAIELIGSYNIDFEGGPPLHYLIADAGGNAALVEFYQGEMVVVPGENGWHQATNFLNSAVKSPRAAGWRYDTVYGALEATQGALDIDSALTLLSEVAQPDTQWSVVYNQTTGAISIVMGRDYATIHEFQLPLR